MIIKTQYPTPSTGLLVRWTLNGKYDQAAGDASEGVTVPDKATILDIALTGVGLQTTQISFDPAFEAYFAEVAA